MCRTIILAQKIHNVKKKNTAGKTKPAVIIAKCYSHSIVPVGLGVRS